VQRVRPAYRQVADELRNQIVAGLLPAGHRLPNEAELSRAFGVSRSTVREALRVLTSQHLIETLRGVRGGSFVAAPDPARMVEDIGGALGVLVMTPRRSRPCARRPRHPGTRGTPAGSCRTWTSTPRS
jgi:GntR family transcriptional repressor for pyruvate dehydrogenase complex